MNYSKGECEKAQRKKHTIKFLLYQFEKSTAIRKKLEQCNKRINIMLYETQSRASRRKSDHKGIDISKKINVKTEEKQILN